jgi:hypothetical protein
MPAYGKTKLQVVNEVLERLRESTVATTSSTTYATLVARVLNSVKTEIEQSWAWLNLRDTYNVTATPGVTSYALTGSGQYAQILDIWNGTTKRKLSRGTFASFNAKFFGVDTLQTGDVTEYLPVGVDSNFDLQFDVWPNPTASNLLKVNIYAPQADPETDATVIVVPSQILIEGILAYMLAERGDDNGTAAQAQQAYYRALLAGSVATEGGHDPSEQDWQPI